MSAYIARYDLDESGDDLREVILMRDEFWSPRLAAEFDRLARLRQSSEPMLQGWYHNDWQTQLVAWTNQPFALS